jgi:hypothetical protein
MFCLLDMLVDLLTRQNTSNVDVCFYEEIGRVFDQVSRYDMKIILGDFSAKVGRENIFKLMIGNESLREISNDSGVRIVNFPTSKNLVVKSTMFPHRKIHKHTWTSPEENTQPD